MVQWFPSMSELLIPNWNMFTLIGILAIIVGLFGLIFLKKFDKIISGNVALGSLWAILIGVALVWGVSIIQDLLGSWGLWIVVGVGVIVLLLIWRFKGTGGGGTAPQDIF